jgi:hypothetical protein
VVVEHKDVVLALLGASAGLAGLLLVFLGLVVAAYGGLPGDVPNATRRPYRRTGVVLMIGFVVGLVCIGLAVTWLAELRGGEALYVSTIVAFAVQLVGLLVATCWTLQELLWA